jgi:DNA-binding transcriptional MerR regulator
MPQIPDKVYFRIGEVAEIVGVETHVLRYWESEFPQVRPERTASKQRLYQRSHLEMFLEIKRLLYEEEYTISGARKKLDRMRRGDVDADDTIDKVKSGLREIKRILD